MVFLDASPVSYYVEQPAIWGPKATTRLAALRTAGEKLALTELVRMECLVGPVKAGNASLLADFTAFFSTPDVLVLPITTAVAERAARIRAIHRLLPLDSLHLAAAVEHSCSLFITNDARLTAFPDIAVEVLS